MIKRGEDNENFIFAIIWKWRMRKTWLKRKRCEINFHDKQW